MEWRYYRKEDKGAMPKIWLKNGERLALFKYSEDKERETRQIGEKMTKRDAWNYAINLSKVDGGEPDEEFLRLVEKEINGEITIEDIHKILIEKYTVNRSETNGKDWPVFTRRS